jgi:hypothetical protein
LDISQYNKNTQQIFSKSSTKDNSLDICHYDYDNRDSFDCSKLQQMVIKDLLGNQRNTIKLDRTSNTHIFRKINNINNFNQYTTYIKENININE